MQGSESGGSMGVRTLGIRTLLRSPQRWGLLLLLALFWTLTGCRSTPASEVNEPTIESAPGPEETDVVTLVILGRVVNTQRLAIADAEVRIYIGGRQHTLDTPDGEEVERILTGEDGLFRLVTRLPRQQAEAIAAGQQAVAIEVQAHAFRTTRLGLPVQQLTQGGDHDYADIGTIVLPRAFHLAFFIAVLVFALTFAAISLRLLHETMAALGGATIVLAITHMLGSRYPDFWILDFERSIQYIDFDVIFLVLALMIFVAITGRTGVFQWMAYSAYRLSGGRPWLLSVILVLITTVTSAFLNNVTIMLLIAPVTVQIALAMGINPLALLIPEVLASNIGGTATLIGDPPNTLIGSYARLGFSAFLTNLGPIVLLIVPIFIVLTWLIYRQDYRRAGNGLSAALIAHLEESARITDPALLRKASIAAVVTLGLFFLGDLFRMPPSVAALIGAVGLMVWTRPSIHEMLQEVDWTTLLFFIALFILVGALQEVGAIQVVAEGIGKIAGDNLVLAVLLILWVPALGSALVANIPFAAAMLPVAAYLTQTIPGAGNNVLYWALALGTCLGGNATLIGAAANIVTAGVAERAGYPLPFKKFAEVGIPITIVTLILSTVYLLIRY
ncbi:MAG TPA: citrate transporter [Chloroflexi bacterium]|nr:citrate transporter [Chloroflexota bacterium]